MSEPRLPSCPYPGIEPFTYGDRGVFFARDDETRVLVNRIVLHRGALLFAESGVGKSSLLNAGLIPACETQGFQCERIRVQPRVDQEIVIERIGTGARAEPPFLPSLVGDEDDEPQVVLSVGELVERVRRRSGGPVPLLIFDQFEEWVTLFQEPAEPVAREDRRRCQQRIADGIVALVNDRTLPVKVLIALREDYLAQLAPLFERCPDLPDNYVRLLPLNGEQVYRVIRGPYDEFPGRFSPELPARLAKEIQRQFEEKTAGGSVQLTEVQIVCRTLFEAAAAGRDLDEEFKDGVQGILERYFDGTLNSLEPEERDPAVALLSKLVTAEGTRNVVSRENLITWVERDDGVPRGLLTRTLAGLAGKIRLVRCENRRQVEYCEIASEFLIARIRSRAAEWRRQVEERHLRERLEREHRERRRKGIAVALSVAVLAGIAYLTYRTAVVEAQRDRADVRRWDAVAHALVAWAQSTFDETLFDETLGALLAVQAEKVSRKGTPGRHPEVLSVLMDVAGRLGVTASPTSTVVIPPDSPVACLAISPDASRIADVVATIERGESAGDPLGSFLGCDRGRVRLRDLERGNRRPLPGSVWGVAVAFSRDGRSLAVSRDDGSVEVRTGAPEFERSVLLPGPTEWVRALAFSADGAFLATGGEDQTVRLWRLGEAPESVATLSEPEDWVRSVAFSPDGTLLAAGGDDQILRVWRLGDPVSLAAALEGHEDWIRTVAFSPTDPVLASGGDDGTVRLWDIAAGGVTPGGVLRHEGWVMSLAFSPDGQKLAAGSTDGTIQVWHLRQPDLVPLTLTVGSSVNALLFTAGGDTLLSADAAGGLLAWGVGTSLWMTPAQLAAAVCREAERNLSWEEWLLYMPGEPYDRTCPYLVDSSFVHAGRAAARAGLLDSARAVFERWRVLDSLSIDPARHAEGYYAEGTLKAAETLAARGAIDTARALVEGARQRLIPELAPVALESAAAAFLQGATIHAWEGKPSSAGEAMAAARYAMQLVPAGSALLRETRDELVDALAGLGQDLASKNDIRAALAAFDSARALHPEAVVPGFRWNNLCWYASTWGRAAEVMFACERAIAMDSSNASWRDSRGLARALTGDVSGAIVDFEFFARRGDNGTARAQRRQWVAALRSGKNPFTPEVLKMLREEQ